MQYRPSGPAHYRWKTVNVSKQVGWDRAQKLFRNIGPCSICGSVKSERHHIDGNPCNNVPENISILCRRCHLKIDGRLNKFANPYCNGLAKLSYVKAREIRKSNESGPKLATKYGVSVALISLVRLNKIWKDGRF